ncbi:MAG: malto-oligosyltrehalose synthase, partial [Nitriliruptoraceae bacterium]|nr:malto-oligosyltrehalose synthase [Nitriliruptoraceae bacterium]
MSAARPGRDRPAGPLRVGVADRVLTATYRLQLHDGFTFADAAAQLERLQALGISHLYLSPSLEAVPGSTHGYDVTDPTRIRATLGGEDGLRALASRAHEVGMGLILDIVPNHVGLVSPVNPWWFDTLAHGPDSRFGRHLDVFWQPGAHGQPTLLVPELGERLPQALAGDALQLAHVDDGRVPAWRVVYHDHQWPVRPGSLAAVGLDVAELDPDDAEVARAVTACREDRTLLAALLDHQHYRLGFWRRANDELDHRRFFDIDTLGAVRIEDPAVFADVHAAVLPLLADGTLDGLRIDHPDGLADPVGYLRRLRAAVGPEPWLIVEKILEHDEPYRADWPIDGTVGYGFADRVLGLHIDPAAGPVFDDLQTSLVGAPFDREAQADAAKRTALDTLFGAERARLAAALAAADPELADDPAVDDLDALLGELLVVWPVYRTYVRHDDDLADPEVPSEDVAVIGRAVARATARRPELGPAFERVRGLLDGTVRTAQAATFVTRFQQLTGPAIAKGLEDTVLYRDTRFVAVNEVGADPGHLGASVAAVHAPPRRPRRGAAPPQRPLARPQPH